MVVLNKIYTKTGDGGETAFGDGQRVAKDDIRVEAYGTVDEANACFGLARLHADADTEKAIARIQNDLFDLGADLCRPEEGTGDAKNRNALRISEAQIQRLEAEIDRMNEELEPLRSFVLPGGSGLSAYFHLCRTVVRRAERAAVTLSKTAKINPAALKYLNRLSDWCFCAGRVANDRGKDDLLWVPGQNG